MEETKRQIRGLRQQGNRLLWRASKAAVNKGYPVKSANLTALSGNEPVLRERCAKLQREMTEWMTGVVRRSVEFDGTFRSILDLYENDPKSSFHKLKRSTKQPYQTYIRMLREQIGHCRIDNTDGRDVEEWFSGWARPEKVGQPRMLAKAHVALATLKSSLAFAIVCRKPGCVEFAACIPKRFERPKSRKLAITAEQVAAVRQAAHEIQHPGAALAYALQFEGSIRQWDVVGTWEPLSDQRSSAVIDKGKKWLGLTWKDVDADMVLRWTPTKTEDSSGETITIDLSACPMVMEELEMKLAAGKPLNGPLVVDRKTGLPYRPHRFEEAWRSAAALAGIPKEVWNRDLRKSGSTEARRSGAPIDDVRKVMGHGDDSEITQKVYDLADLEAHRRVAASRLAYRKQKQ